MRGRAGVVAVVLGLFAAGLAAGGINAGPMTPPPTTSDTTTTDSTTATTSTAVTTTTATTTTTTVPPSAPVTELAAPARPPSSCVFVAAFALLEPGRPQLVLGHVAETGAGDVTSLAVGYPADGSIVTASSIGLHAAGCGKGARAHAQVQSVSLFGGAVTARSVALGVRRNVSHASVSVQGLAISGRSVPFEVGRPLRVGDWGDAVVLAVPDREEAGGLAVHLNKERAGLPAGTTVFVSVARVSSEEPLPPAQTQTQTTSKTTTTAKEEPPAKPATSAHAPRSTARPHAASRPKTKKRKRKRKTHRPRKHLGDDPLTVTPPLGFSPPHYVFPVTGKDAGYGDSYGAFRGDVPGSWHHGDDIFAKLGTPVVAVADGTLNRVGWERLGGWRLWVRDETRNEFYYAHLSGYSTLALHSKHVKAGDVIGFVGNTGDAFTTPPHLHFEIHPHQLLRLDYNGAVDPTGYLGTWRRLDRPRAPLPAHPGFPHGKVRAEARFVWRQLLAARGLTAHAPAADERPHISTPAPDHFAATARRTASVRVRSDGAGGQRVVDALAGILAPALLFGAALVVRLRRRLP